MANGTDDRNQTLSAPSVRELAEQLIARAERETRDCLELSKIGDLAQEADLGEDEVQALEDILEERGLELRDDCGRAESEPVTYLPDDLAVQTTDAMALFLQEVRRHPLLTKEEE